MWVLSVLKKTHASACRCSYSIYIVFVSCTGTSRAICVMRLPALLAVMSGVRQHLCPIRRILNGSLLQQAPRHCACAKCGKLMPCHAQ